MRTAALWLSGGLAVIVVLMVQRARLHAATRRDAQRIRPFRYIEGMEQFDPKLRDHTRHERVTEEQAVQALRRELGNPTKPRLFRAS